MTMANLPFNVARAGAVMTDDQEPRVLGDDQRNRQWCEHNEDAEECVKGWYNYRLNAGANGVFMSIAALLFFTLLFATACRRKARVYSVALALGLLSQVAGYAGRFSCVDNQLNRNGFYVQIIFLTIGPAFLAAAIYWETRAIVCYFGERFSIIPPRAYLLVSCRKCRGKYLDRSMLMNAQFLPCDLVSLVLQATGGGIAAHAHRQDRLADMKVGTNIMIAGLSFQAFTMFAFSLLGSIFAYRVMRDEKQKLQQQHNNNEIVAARPGCFGLSFGEKCPGIFRCFLGSLAFSTLLIFVRSIYRVAELSGGWQSTLMSNQTLFIIFEGVFVTLASISLVVFSPGWSATALMEFKEQEKNREKNEDGRQLNQPPLSPPRAAHSPDVEIVQNVAESPASGTNATPEVNEQPRTSTILSQNVAQ